MAGHVYGQLHGNPLSSQGRTRLFQQNTTCTVFAQMKTPLQVPSVSSRSQQVHLMGRVGRAAGTQKFVCRRTQTKAAAQQQQSQLFRFGGTEAAPAKNKGEVSGKNMALRFCVHVPCEFGDNVQICGNVDQLGMWDPQRSLPLTWSDGDLWSADIAIDEADVSECEFKVVVACRDGTYSWEAGANQRILFDNFDEEHEARIFVNWYCPPGEELVLVGDHAGLGAWDPESGVVMEDLGDGTWCATLPTTVAEDVHEGEAVEYKVVRRSASGEFLWMCGENRVLEADTRLRVGITEDGELFTTPEQSLRRIMVTGDQPLKGQLGRDLDAIVECYPAHELFAAAAKSKLAQSEPAPAPVAPEPEPEPEAEPEPLEVTAEQPEPEPEPVLEPVIDDEPEEEEEAVEKEEKVNVAASMSSELKQKLADVNPEQVSKAATIAAGGAATIGAVAGMEDVLLQMASGAGAAAAEPALQVAAVAILAGVAGRNLLFAEDRKKAFAALKDRDAFQSWLSTEALAPKRKSTKKVKKVNRRTKKQKAAAENPTEVAEKLETVSKRIDALNDKISKSKLIQAENNATSFAGNDEAAETAEDASDAFSKGDK